MPLTSTSATASAIIQTLAYAQVFNFPLTSSEISRWLISPPTQSSDSLQSPEYLDHIIHAQLSTICEYHHGYYFLKSAKQSQVGERLNSLNYTQQKLATARRIAHYLSYIPTIELIAVTGSVAAFNAKADDDIDLMIIASPGALWTTRLQVTAALDLLRVRRHPGQHSVKDYICANLYLDSDHLEMDKSKHDLYIAHEVLQAIPIFDRYHTYAKFLQANSWTANFLPNAWHYAHLNLLSLIELTSAEIQPPSNQAFKYLLKPIESLSFAAQRAYMAPKHTTETITTHSAYFHPRDYRTWVNQSFQKQIQGYNNISS